MEKVLDVKGLCKTYVVNKRQNNVLKNIDLTINEGEMVSVMGPSGSGKSTLLYCVSGMDRPTSGEVSFDGKDISKLNDKKLAEVRLDEMGFIFQQMYMMKNLSVLDNVILPSVRSKKNKESRKETERRGRDLMKRMGIDDIAENDINEASGGQLQRACICRSLMNHPKVIFADEPTGALNRSTSDEVFNELLEINREGTAVMCVTHDAKVAAKCSRVLYIMDGSIHAEIKLGKYDGTESELRTRERTLNNWLMEQGW
ncbi:putative ABC transport system ATP-binding protein [Ruminococcus sp. YE71]|uniref:ABC transporter ATP-binding protein n=1 Tax=unclassified Ruminococcus TaxID=2608920 RepID=UPI000891A0A7|nr:MULTISPECIES: ABC transporter ATP-binding protein [unclassified Ruminococcus]SDA09963.1 putative ABC transport system ATP-binding protein [Ruminococcus sp. YE78]SFW11210.1 putative ABC transport system ATP-binding protein [Ruminococcus sp. YE71]